MITTDVMLSPRQYEIEIRLLADTCIELLSTSDILDVDVFGLLIAIENLNYDSSHELNYKMSVIKRLYIERAIAENVIKKREEKEKHLSDVGRYINGYMKESLF